MKRISNRRYKVAGNNHWHQLMKMRRANLDYNDDNKVYEIESFLIAWRFKREVSECLKSLIVNE